MLAGQLRETDGVSSMIDLFARAVAPAQHSS
jgi:hypothetical protein